jgi:hypothetical protein
VATRKTAFLKMTYNRLHTRKSQCLKMIDNWKRNDAPNVKYQDFFTFNPHIKVTKNYRKKYSEYSNKSVDKVGKIW